MDGYAILLSPRGWMGYGAVMDGLEVGETGIVCCDSAPFLVAGVSPVLHTKSVTCHTKSALGLWV